MPANIVITNKYKYIRTPIASTVLRRLLRSDSANSSSDPTPPELLHHPGSVYRI